MKKLKCVVLLMAMTLLLSGCRMYESLMVNEDGTVTEKSKIALTAEEAAMMGADTSQCTIETLEDGKKYYVGPEETKTTKLSKFKKEGMILTGDIFCYFLDDSEEEQDADMATSTYLQLSVSLLGDITESNADMTVEGNKAVFTFPENKDDVWYAYTAKGKEQIENDKEAPKMKGAKNNRYYKKMPGNIEFTDNVAIKQITLNGKVVQPMSLEAHTFDKSGGLLTTWGTDGDSDVSKKGKNVFKVTDLSGNESTFIIYIDKKKPVIKGIKNNKTYKKATFYVKDAMKLSSVTINGKKQKLTKAKLVKKGKYKGYYKYTVKKKGVNRIVAKDAAGNKVTYKISIVK